ncbi:MAG: hypothetical protein MZV64_41155 [Ignavibacteriales bacterium]|nr:hypothetical protein [Ignavibacteriales bacterium]
MTTKFQHGFNGKHLIPVETGKKDCSSMMLSIWDNKEKVTLGIDLWTKEMMVEDMNVHVHQTLLKLSDTYLRATKILKHLR